MFQFDEESLQLTPFQYRGEIWYKNLFAALDAKGVNARLKSASPERIKIARDIIQRGKACHRVQELAELDNYKKQAALFVENRAWAERAEAALTAERSRIQSVEQQLQTQEQQLQTQEQQLQMQEQQLKSMEAALSQQTELTRLHNAELKRLRRHWWVRLGKNTKALDWNHVEKQDVPPSVTVQSTPKAGPVPVPFQMEPLLQHLVDKKFSPQVVLDVGAAKGYWSELASYFFPAARFYLLEPLKPNQVRLKELSEKKPAIKYLHCAAGDKAGEQVINVTTDLDGSSLLSFNRERQPQDEVVKIVTIDSLLAEKKIEPPQLVKMDVQGYELRALEGGKRLFDTAEVFIMEVSLFEFMPGCPLLHEVVDYMARRNFVVFDIAGFLRRPYENDLGQVDLVFVKKTNPMVASNRWS